MKKLYLIVGHLFFLALAYLSLTFYKERMLTADPAFFSFRIIQNGTFDIELNRWGSVLSQLLPLAFLKNGCSLETFLKVYSISFILIYYLIFLIITFGLRNYEAGIALMLTLCLTFRHSFYYPTAELYQGLAICILIWAVAQKMIETNDKRYKGVFFIITIFLIYAVSYFHQIGLLAVLFIISFEILNRKKFTDPWLLGILALSIVWFYVRVKYLTTTQYETEKIITFNVFKEQINNLTTLPSYIFLMDFFKTYLRPFVLLMLVNVFLLFRQKKWLLIVFIFGFISSFLIIDIITYYKGDSTIMYENYLVMLGLFAAIPFTGIIKNFRVKKWTWGFSVILLLWNLVEIYKCHLPYSERVAYIQRLTDRGHQFSEKKYLIDQRNFPWLYGWVDWALPFETLLSSSLQGPDSSITVHSAPFINQYDTCINNKNIFLGPHWAVTWFWSNDFNSNYFRLPPTGYKKLSSLQSDTSFHESIFNSQNIILQPQNLTTSYYEIKVMKVNIINNSNQVINSIRDLKNGIALSYHIYDANNNRLLFYDGYRTALESDVIKNAEQSIVINERLLRGKYFVEVDFVSEYKRWWNINARSELTVK